MICPPACRVNIKNGNNTIGHCPLCHNDFSGTTAYDRHISRDREGRMLCKDLATLEGWFDEKNVWHYGEKMSPEQIAKIWSA